MPRMTEVSTSPYTVRARVRGIGVAVMISTSGAYSDLFTRAARWFTPKRCCSSVTTKARWANTTSSCNSAWVPTKIFRLPSASSCKISRRSAALVLLVNSFMEMPVPLKNSVRVSRCCWAKIPVGAMMHPWKPFSAVLARARAAMTVLPLPTSP